MDESKIQAIKEWLEPKNTKDIQAFLGYVNFYRRFISGYRGIATPLTNLTQKNTPFLWDNKA